MEVYIKRPLPPDSGSPNFENSNELSMNEKIAWSGAVTSVQPRIRLTRSFDERSHTYLGYLLRIEGTVGGVSAEFRVGIGSGTHAKSSAMSASIPFSSPEARITLTSTINPKPVIAKSNRP